MNWLLRTLGLDWSPTMVESAYYMDRNMAWRRRRGIPSYLARHMAALREIRERVNGKG